MWSKLGKILRKLFGGGAPEEPPFRLPEGEGRLSEDFSNTQELEGTGGAVTAHEALELARDIILKFDPESRLTTLESKGPLTDDGRAHRWYFLFHMPTRWGRASFFFDLRSGKESLRVEMRPFVAKGSAMAKMLEEGRDGFVEQQWKVELERNPALPARFKDSQAVVASWLSAGNTVDSLPGSAVLRASTPPLGKARWELLETQKAKKSLYSTPIE